MDLAQLLRFLTDTQAEAVEAMGIAEEGPARTRFLHWLQGEIAKRGVIDVLRKGLSHGPQSVSLYYGTPTPGNAQAAKRFEQNIFSVTRQLRYSADETRLTLDLVIFINGLPVIVKQFNELWGDIPWQDKDKVWRIITEELPAKVAADRAYQNAQEHSDKNAARIEHDRALRDSILAFLSDQTELFKQFQDNASFRKWLCDSIFAATYQKAAN